MGATIYKIIFFVINFIAKLFATPHVASLRNSIYLPYFEFLKSDLDISIFTPPSKKLISECKTLNKLYKSIPIIKEINFYFRLEHQVKLQNYYEYLRDPKLLKLNKDKAVFVNEEKFVFLLRMYVANFAQKNFLDSRTIVKFKYYLNLCALNPSFSDEKELLKKIIENTIGNNQELIFKEVMYLLDGIRTKRNFEFIFQNSSNQILLSCLFPQFFYFLNPQLNRSDEYLKKIAFLQLCWELWGLSTQVYLFDRGIEQVKIFKNNQHLLSMIEIDTPNFTELKQNCLKDSQLILEAISF